MDCPEIHLWWGQAKLRAENSTYYNLSGYLASITSAAGKQLCFS